jgi:hypothetical protein
MDFSQDLPTKLAKSQASLGVVYQSRAPSGSGFHSANHATKFVNRHLIYIHRKDDVADSRSCIFGREMQNLRKLELWVVKTISIKLAPA